MDFFRARAFTWEVSSVWDLGRENLHHGNNHNMIDRQPWFWWIRNLCVSIIHSFATESIFPGAFKLSNMSYLISMALEMAWEFIMSNKSRQDKSKTPAQAAAPPPTSNDIIPGRFTEADWYVLRCVSSLPTVVFILHYNEFEYFISSSKKYLLHYDFVWPINLIVVPRIS